MTIQKYIYFAGLRLTRTERKSYYTFRERVREMGDHPTEETQFVVDEVSNVIKEAIETTIGGNSYTVGNIEEYLLSW